jgi:hypothetical protein
MDGPQGRHRYLTGQWSTGKDKKNMSYEIESSQYPE